MNRLFPKFDNSKTYKNLILWIVFIIAFAIPIYQALDAKVVRHFDEPRTVINSYEMFSTNNFLVTTYNYVPDIWNTKPPLLNWLQVFCMHIWGPDILATRIPSATSAILLCIVFLYFSIKETKYLWIGIVASA